VKAYWFKWSKIANGNEIAEQLCITCLVFSRDIRLLSKTRGRWLRGMRPFSTCLVDVRLHRTTQLLRQKFLQVLRNDPVNCDLKHSYAIRKA
jgi:hypothetical protein